MISISSPEFKNGDIPACSPRNSRVIHALLSDIHPLFTRFHAFFTRNFCVKNAQFLREKRAISE
jgi:hypothetical protein